MNITMTGRDLGPEATCTSIHFSYDLLLTFALKTLLIDQLLRESGGLPITVRMPCETIVVIESRERLLWNWPCPCGNPNHWIVRWARNAGEKQMTSMPGCPKCGARCETSMEDFLRLKEVCYACGTYKIPEGPLAQSTGCRTGELEIKMQRLHKLESQVSGLQANRQVLRKIITELAGVCKRFQDTLIKVKQATEEIGE